MKKNTDKIIQEIKEADSLECAINKNAGEFDSALFLKNLKSHFVTSGLSQAELARKSDISTAYLNNLLKGIKQPSRDIVIKLAFGFELSVDNANKLLKLAGYSDIYPRIEREAVILYCLNKHVGLIDTNILLDKRGFEKL